MTTGGGWQDQAGGIFPGAKLVASGPGLHQRLRVQPVPWTAEREAEFESRLVLYYTGIRRVARDLLQQVVGSYLARETACRAGAAQHQDAGHGDVVCHAGGRLGASGRAARPALGVEPGARSQYHERAHPPFAGTRAAVHPRSQTGGRRRRRLPHPAGAQPEAASDLRRLLQQQPGAGAGVHTCSIAEEGLRCADWAPNIGKSFCCS